MKYSLSVSLDQWQAFAAVVDSGGYAAAATALGKSQSSISYAIQRLEAGLGLKVLELKGRRAGLTEAGETLYRRARGMLDDVARLEVVAADLARGWEAEVRVVADMVFPSFNMLAAIKALAAESQVTRVELFEHALSGSEDLLLNRAVDLAILGHLPPGFLGDLLVRIPFMAVASPEHPLLRTDSPLTDNDLHEHRQAVVRDSGVYRRRDSGWLKAEQRLTVGHFRSSVEALRLGLAFAWLPEPYIRDDLRSGRLRELPLVEGRRRFADLYLVFGDRDAAGPATRRLAELIQLQAEYLT